MRKSLFILPLILFCYQVSSQTRQNQLALWQQYQNDSLKLVWLPVTTEAWMKGVTSGYSLERATVIKGKVQKFEMLAPKIIPAPLNEIKGSAEEINIASMVLKDEPVSDDLSGQKEAGMQNLRHLLVTVAARKSYSLSLQLGLGYVDQTAAKNTRYMYRVILLGTGKDTAYVSAGTGKPSALLQPPLLKAESLEKQVMLTWPARSFVKEFLMYHIERCSEGSTYERLTESPVMYTELEMETLFYKDSLGENYRPYLYRLVGINPFGQWVTSEIPTVGMGRDLTPPEPPRIVSSKHITGSLVSITWETGATPDLRGFRIIRSNSVRSGQVRLNPQLLSPSTTTFTDQQADIHGTNHYTVIAVDTAGNEASSLPAFVVMEDSIPPVPPRNVYALSDTLGRVHITWDKSPDDDVKGYYVYFANAPDHEFSQITKTMLTETSFRDTISLRSLSKHVYYKIVAVDHHFNHSQLSEPFALKRPDVIRPIAPLIEKIEARVRSVALTWFPSSSNDVVRYRVLRKTAKTDFTPVSEVQADAGLRYTFEDSGIETGIRYTYCLVAIDESGLLSDRSPSKGISVSEPPKAVTAPVLVSKYDKQKKVNAVTWTFSEKDNFRIAIYRIEGKAGYKLIGFCDSKTNTFADPVAEKNKYKYCSRAILADGTHSPWSNEVTTH